LENDGNQIMDAGLANGGFSNSRAKKENKDQHAHSSLLRENFKDKDFVYQEFRYKKNIFMSPAPSELVFGGFKATI
jgi:hypothetical protein